MNKTKISRPLTSLQSKLEKFWLYETATFYYLIGYNNNETEYYMLKINRTISKPKILSEIVYLDDLIYSETEIAEILQMIHEGNHTSGGLIKVCSAVGLVGFVKFLDCYYFTLITQRKEVGCIGGNYNYSIKATEIFPIIQRDEPDNNTFRRVWKKLNKKLNQTSTEIAESRYMGLFQFVDLTKDFFFSYSYDPTYSLQHNYISSAVKGQSLQQPKSQEMFEWNHYQTEEFRNVIGPNGASLWALPIIHGSYQQKRFSFFGKIIDMIVIARRSRHYAGTRYLKRGVNIHGKVANDVEIEQIIQYEDGFESQFCSYIQMRGSIPTYWFQETSVTQPKPPILLNRVDPNYLATEGHFADLFRRYSSPIIVLDLVKQQERRARESIVGKEFRQAVEVLNENISAVEHKIRYIALDYSKITSISKGKGKKSGAVDSQMVKVKDKERAMAAVGNEWAMMESSLVGDVTANLSQKKKSDGNESFPKPMVNVRSGTDDNNSLVNFSQATRNRADSSGSILSPRQVVTSVPNMILPSNSVGGGHHFSGERIDVLRELEDIANLTISETSFFSNSVSRLEKIKLVNKKQVLKAKKQGFIAQSGVLRTNCIDCLDRTNGGQFAVAMKFLALSLQTLGLSHAESLEPTSQLLLALMDMFGEMGDKIALQYGGSEAHRKVLAGKGGQAASSSKQSELLTSIKRYYSNAFTDMVKQDAMNIFLGCYVPTDSQIQLWELETDYHLHNKTLSPPEPQVNFILNHEIPLDNQYFQSHRVMMTIEMAIKKTLLPGLLTTTSGTQIGSPGRAGSPFLQDFSISASTTQGHPSPSINNLLMAAMYSNQRRIVSNNLRIGNAENANEDGTTIDEAINKDHPVRVQMSQSDDNTSMYVPNEILELGEISLENIIGGVNYLHHNHFRDINEILESSPKIDLSSITARYFIRNLLLVNNSNQLPQFMIKNNSSREPSEKPSLKSSSDENIPSDSTHVFKPIVSRTNSATFPEPSPETSITSKRSVAPRMKLKTILLNAVRSIARCERRKFAQKVANDKILRATEIWWRKSLLDYATNLYGEDYILDTYLNHFNSTANLRNVNSFRNSTQRVISDKELAPAAPDVHLKFSTYFTRVHKPYEITEFDTLMQLDYFIPVDAVNTASHGGGTVTKLVEISEIEDDSQSPMANHSLQSGNWIGGLLTDVPNAFTSAAASVVSTATDTTNAFFGSSSSTTSSVVSNTTTQRDRERQQSGQMMSIKENSQKNDETKDKLEVEVDPTVLAGGADPIKRSDYYFFYPSASINTQNKVASPHQNLVLKHGSGQLYSTQPPDEMNQSLDSAQNYEANNYARGGVSSFQFGRYMRDIGQKARTLVDGLLGRENDQSSSSAGNMTKSKGAYNQQSSSYWDWRHQQINLISHEAPKSSVVLYNRYVQIHEDNLILMNDNSATRVAEEEYYMLLRDLNVDVDNVGGMEHLSIESFISQEVYSGMYQGMRQYYDSANMAHAFIMMCLINVESELEHCGVLIDDNTGLMKTDTTLGSKKYIPQLNLSGNSPIQSMKGSKISSSKHFQSKANLNIFDTHPSTQQRIATFFHKANAAPGLQTEFKKNLNNYIFQKYAYGKEISMEKLNARISSYTSEKSILEYTQLFDRDTLATSLTTVSFIAVDSHQYTSFNDLFTLQASLGTLQYAYYSQKQKYLQSREVKKTAFDQESEVTTTSVVLKPVAIKPNSLKMDQVDKVDVTEESKPVPIVTNSMSTQLGMTKNTSNLGLNIDEELLNDYSLSLYTDFNYDVKSLLEIPYGNDSEYHGFTAIGPDLYLKNANQYLHLNEVAVVRLNQVLKQQTLVTS